MAGVSFTPVLYQADSRQQRLLRLHRRTSVPAPVDDRGADQRPRRAGHRHQRRQLRMPLCPPYRFVTAGSLVAETAQSPAVPEPATWGLMLRGFGASGFALRAWRGSPLIDRRGAQTAYTSVSRSVKSGGAFAYDAIEQPGSLRRRASSFPDGAKRCRSGQTRQPSTPSSRVRERQSVLHRLSHSRSRSRR